MLLTGKFSQLDLVHAVAEAASGMLNEGQTHLCVPATSLIKGSDSTLIVGADEEFAAAAAASGHLYGAYYNVRVFVNFCTLTCVRRHCIGDNR